jgi:hypothetical protein
VDDITVTLKLDDIFIGGTGRQTNHAQHVQQNAIFDILSHVFLFGVEGFYNYIHAKVHKSEQFTKNYTFILHSE